MNHWVVDTIPGSVTTISSVDIAAGKYTPGRRTGDFVGYQGPCPPNGDAAHHDIVTLYALSAPPALPAGLDRDGVMAAMQGKVLGATTTIMRFAPGPWRKKRRGVSPARSVRTPPPAACRRISPRHR